MKRDHTGSMPTAANVPPSTAGNTGGDTGSATARLLTPADGLPELTGCEVVEGWKVCKVRRDGRLAPLHDPRINAATFVDYRVGQWSVPSVENSLLFGFGDLETAAGWVNRIVLGRVLYRALLASPQMCPWMLRCWTRDLVRHFWSGAHAFDQKLWTELPRGTVACRAIKILEEVKL